MKIRTVNSIYTLEESHPDDLFICSVSFEERCLNAASLLSKGYYTTKRALVIRYFGENRRGFKETHQDKLCKDILPSFIIDKEIGLLELDKYDVLSFWYNFEDWFENKEKPRTITIDISTFTKSFLLVLLKFLRQNFPDSKVRILYTMAYYPTRPKNVHLSWGIKDIVFLPHFGSFKNAKNGKNLLFLFLGYEAERAYGIWRFIEPTHTVAILGEPPTYPRAELPARYLNRFILEHPEASVETVSALNPIESKEKINEWYKKQDYEDFLFFISPLGTKMQVVGIYLFFEEHEPLTKAQIVYALPVRYNDERYSIGYEKGKVWECHLQEKGNHSRLNG